MNTEVISSVIEDVWQYAFEGFCTWDRTDTDI